MITTHGGGTSRKRMHAAKDYSGAEIMRTLRDEVWNREIPVVDFTAAIELILDETATLPARCCSTWKRVATSSPAPRPSSSPPAARDACTIRASPPPTTTAPPPTASSSLSRGRAAPLRRHPPVPSHRRGLPAADLRRAGHGKGALHGRHAHQRRGEAFMHPLETRDVSAASIIRECKARGKGVTTPEARPCGSIRR